MKTMLYTNPNRERPGDPMYTSDDSTFAHACDGSRIVNRDNSSIYLMDPFSSHLWGLWASVVASATAVAHYDAIFEDDADDVYGITTMPCSFSESTWLSTSQSEIANLTYPVIYNGLGVLSAGYGVSSSISLNSVAIGGMMETCYTQKGSSPKVGPKVWAAAENTELQMSQQDRVFICYSNNTSSAATAYDARTFAYASFLLTYDPATSVLWEYFSTPSNFHVQPESKLVPMYPVVSAPATVDSLKLASGVYGREYAACYLYGANVGPCAAVVNPDPYHSYAYPYGSKYGHTLLLSGGGVLDGGTISLSGPAPAGILPPQGSMVLFR